MNRIAKEETLARLLLFSNSILLAIGGKTLGREELIDELMNETRIGEQLVDMHLKHLKYLKENPLKV